MMLPKIMFTQKTNKKRKKKEKKAMRNRDATIDIPYFMTELS